MKRRVCLSLLWFVASSAPLRADDALLAPEPFAHIRSKPINEMSGIVKSRRRDNLFWTHNDSGDSARIFALDSEGRSVLPTYSKFTAYGDEPVDGKEQWQGFPVLYAQAVDWEDIAIDDKYIYIADIGNNANERKDLTIYLISEIDPTASTRSAVVKALQVAYPEQKEFPPAEKNFDSESIFIDDGKVYVITKHRGGGLTGLGWQAGANLYRLDTAYTDRPNVLTRVDSHPELTAATSADLSPDGRTLAVLSYTELYLFRDPADDLWLSGSTVRRFPLDTDVFRQTEAITWESDDNLVITNEQGDLFRLTVSSLPGSWPNP
jgi:hypothetical protein